ncbi:MAG: methyl-accepting chemotaxis protein, partial [Ruminococcus flavefaciens]|nr:methyl-accepting chemotaxis protein [Ruminococcus flavefaciens]
MKRQIDFFEENDAKVCKNLTKVLRWMTLVFPVLFLATAAGIFQIKYNDLAVLSVFGCICTLGPGVLQKIGTPVRTMKYVSVISVGLVVMLLGGNSAVGIYMTYGLSMLFSCMFFDKKFTKQISVISYFFLIASLFLRSQNVRQIEYPTNMEWFLTRSVGFTIEQIVMSVVFISIAGTSRKLLENLHSTEQVAAVVSKCEEVSTKLVTMMDDLAENVKESRITNETIVSSAQDTSEDCMKSLSHVSSMHDIVSEMVQASGSIDESTKNVLVISDEICQHMEHYVNVMDHAVADMKVIGQAANLTEEAIMNLEASIMEISGFTNEISEITGQTNLLALNASIILPFYLFMFI